MLIALPDDDLDRSQSFYDTTRIVDGLAYLFALAESEKMDAVSINISLGTNGGAHDGSEMMSRWIDAAMTSPGRAICVAAGNSGQEAPEFEGDLGIWSGRVHTSGRIPAAALRRDLEWVVVGNGLEDVSENELEIWYGAEDEFDVELFTPGGRRIGPISPGQRVENLLLADRTVVSIYNVLSDPKNGDNRISIYLSPFMGRADRRRHRRHLEGASDRQGRSQRRLQCLDRARRSRPVGGRPQIAMAAALVLRARDLRRQLDAELARLRSAGDRRRQSR